MTRGSTIGTARETFAGISSDSDELPVCGGCNGPAFKSKHARRVGG
eukprot:CAMPEP_0176100470 /NCGR_PEP_ID=MMETSP0120_2-20121206/50390_1 /TAXON_ID=160619 /ORGANISM="Kryptoperidinium foliaceum, Strain CCMP 1326" /LENGTH=45 /DNA_ID= /DNA_START= /DNA_END= /DNA_ORIENTATION=